jgi:hypothetical protein
MDFFYQRHSNCNDERFAFLNDTITLVIEEGFEINLNEENIECLKNLKIFQITSNRLTI